MGRLKKNVICKPLNSFEFNNINPLEHVKF